MNSTNSTQEGGAMDSLFAHYSLWETALMILLNFCSNLSGLPSIFYNYRLGKSFEVVLALSLLVVVTMYHTCEALGATIYLDSLAWHRLDNVFAHTGFGVISYEIFNIQGRVREYLNYGSLALVILAQEKAPWDLRYTIVPIVLFWLAALLVSRRLGTKTNFHSPQFKKGALWMLAALCCFARGLDQTTDYLRFFHSSWHFMAGMGVQYLSQVNREEERAVTEKSEEEKGNKGKGKGKDYNKARGSKLQ